MKANPWPGQNLVLNSVAEQISKAGSVEFPPEMLCLSSLQGSLFSSCLFLEQIEPG